MPYITFVSLSKKKSMEQLNVNGCYGPGDMSVRMRSVTSLPLAVLLRIL